MKTNKEIRVKSKLDLKGFWTMPVMAALVYMLISGVISGGSYLTNVMPSPSIKSLLTILRGAVSILVAVPLGYGFNLAFLHFIREDKEDTVERIFDGFKTYGRALAVTLLQSLMTFLFFLLLIIPGIIKAIAYSMTVFVSKDNPELTALECIYRSEDLMKGHKMQFFKMYLGFIGITILCIVFTLGIGLLWYIPFMQVAVANFYEEVKAENEKAFAEVSEEEQPVANEENTVED